MNKDYKHIVEKLEIYFFEKLLELFEDLKDDKERFTVVMTVLLKILVVTVDMNIKNEYLNEKLEIIDTFSENAKNAIKLIHKK